MSEPTDVFRRAVIPPMRASVSPVLGSAGAAASSTRSVVDAVNNTQVSVGSVILIVIAALVLFLVVWKVYDIIRKTSLRKIYIHQSSVSTTTAVDLGAGITVPEPLAGREYTFSFWFWLDGTDTFTGDKNLLSMGANAFNFTINNHTLKFSANTGAGSAAQGMVEDSIPIAIQKWTHIMMVVDNNYVTVYKDGDVAASKSVSGNFPTVPKSFLVGPKGSTGNGVAGFLAGLRYFNYVANAKDVRTTYGKGPMSAGLLRYLGLPMYGIRNPFYRIDGVRDLS